MRISVVGAGYVGLVTSACLAEKGHHVCCVDLDSGRVDTIKRGLCPFFEEGLEEILQRNLGRRLSVGSDLRAAVLGSDVTLIAVGTPFDGTAIDLTFLRQAVLDIGEALHDKRDYHVVVVKSTVVPGTTDGLVRPLLEQASGRAAGRDFGVGMNPEFLTEGQAVRDFMEPDRIVLGALDARAMEVLQGMYVGFKGVPTIRTNTRTAEMIKYASNALLATMISFSNELSRLCARLGETDVLDVMRGVHASAYLAVKGRDGQRIPAPIASFLEAGCGYGGSCLPKDVSALVAHGAAMGVPMPLLTAVGAVNQSQPGEILRILEQHFPNLEGRRIAVLGLAFKPDTSDVRQSPAFPIIRLLVEAGARVTAFDPVAIPEARKVLPEGILEYAPNVAECITGADAVVLVTRWREFDALPGLLAGLPTQPLLVDGRRVIDKGSVSRYAGIGL